MSPVLDRGKGGGEERIRRSLREQNACFSLI
jgi:hypothetical protein